MTGTKMHNAMVMDAQLPNGKQVSFSLAEYLAWREWVGMPVLENDVEEVIQWMQAENNNFGRINCWLSVQVFRRHEPNNVAVAQFRLRQDWLNG